MNMQQITDKQLSEALADRAVLIAALNEISDGCVSWPKGTPEFKKRRTKTEISTIARDALQKADAWS